MIKENNATEIQIFTVRPLPPSGAILYYILDVTLDSRPQVCRDLAVTIFNPFKILFFFNLAMKSPLNTICFQPFCDVIIK